MGLFTKKINADKLLDEALCDYKELKFNSCYQKVCKAVELGSARAYFCKALLIYNDNINPNSSPDFEILEELTRYAVEGGYALAYGFYAFILYVSQQNDKLCVFLEKKHKVKDGVYLSYKASYWFGLYTDDEKADSKVTIATMKDSIALLSEQKEKLISGKNNEYEECEHYNPYGKFSLQYTYAHAHFLLMVAYYYENNWDNRSEFIRAFEEILEYMPILNEKFRATVQYMKAILNNQLGMSDLSEANRVMKILNECYEAFDEDEKDAYADEYGEIYDKYDAFYNSEIENVESRDVTYSDGYADKNDISISNITSAIAQGVSRWANTSTCATQTFYTINDRCYTRGEFGYLYDENGMKSNYRIDDISRLYDENGIELGYFNEKGLFISSK